MDVVALSSDKDLVFAS